MLSAVVYQPFLTETQSFTYKQSQARSIGILECLLKAPKQNQKGHQLRLLEDLETLAGTALASGSQDPLNSKMALAIQMMPCEQARCKLKTNQLNLVENTCQSQRNTIILNKQSNPMQPLLKSRHFLRSNGWAANSFRFLLS